MPIPLHDFVLQRLEAVKGTWPLVAEGSGVPLRTIEKIARKETEDPRVSNIQKLADYFLLEDARAAAVTRAAIRSSTSS